MEMDKALRGNGRTLPTLGVALRLESDVSGR